MPASKRCCSTWPRRTATRERHRAEGDRQPRQAVACAAGRARRCADAIVAGQLRRRTWSCCADCDLVIEAIAERMDWKQDLYRKIAPFVSDARGPREQHLGPVDQRAGRRAAEELRHRFCGVHFFNPPRYMHLVELIPARRTDPAVLDGLEAFLTTTLGKGVVLRQGHARTSSATASACSRCWPRCTTPTQFGLGFDVVDALTGPAIGRPKSRDLPHRRRGRPGHDGARHQDDGRHPARRSVASLFPGAGVAGGAGRQGRARAEDRRRHLHASVGKDILVLDLAGAGLPPERRRSRSARSPRILKEQGSRRRNSPSCAPASIRRRSSCGRSSATCSTTAPTTWPTSPTPRATSTSRSAGATAGRSARSRPGRPPAGSRSPDWIAEDIVAGKAMSNAPLPDWVFDGRDGVHGAEGSYQPGAATRSCRAPRCPSTSASASPIRCWARRFDPGETVFENDGVRLWHDGDGIAHRLVQDQDAHRQRPGARRPAASDRHRRARLHAAW